MTLSCVNNAESETFIAWRSVFVGWPYRVSSWEGRYLKRKEGWKTWTIRKVGWLCEYTNKACRVSSSFRYMQTGQWHDRLLCPITIKEKHLREFRKRIKLHPIDGEIRGRNFLQDLFMMIQISCVFSSIASDTNRTNKRTKMSSKSWCNHSKCKKGGDDSKLELGRWWWCWCR